MTTAMIVLLFNTPNILGVFILLVWAIAKQIALDLSSWFLK
jgi:hypothetical protein